MARPMRWLVAVLLAAGVAQAVLGGPGGAVPPIGPTGTVAPGTPAGAAGAALVVQVAYDAGWRGQALADAGAYSWIESGFRPTAVSRTGCEGLWQLCPPPADAFDPAANARHAHAKWQGCEGGSFTCDWTPYDGGTANPAWATGYSLAQKAMAGLPGGGW